MQTVKVSGSVFTASSSCLEVGLVGQATGCPSPSQDPKLIKVEVSTQALTACHVCFKQKPVKKVTR